MLRGVSSENAAALREANAIGPLVHLLLSGSTIEAKEHAAVAIAHIASHASPDAPRSAAQEIAEAGGVSGLISWLADSSQGPPDVAAHALGEIARNNPDMQTQVRCTRGRICATSPCVTPHADVPFARSGLVDGVHAAGLWMACVKARF